MNGSFRSVFFGLCHFVLSINVCGSLPPITSSPEPLGSQGGLIVYPCFCIRLLSSVHPAVSNILSQTARPIKAKFYVQSPWEGGAKIHINGLGRMIRLAAMRIFSRTRSPIILKLGINRSPWLSGRASASGSGGRGFESRPRHTKGVKMVPVATFLGAQYNKASTGFSSPHKYRTTNNATLTKQKKSEKSPIIINVCIHWMTVWKTGNHAKYVILLKNRDYYYYY